MLRDDETLEKLRRGDAALFADPSLPLEVLGGAVAAESIRLGAARYLASRPTHTVVAEGADAWLIDLAQAWWQSEWDARQMALVLGLRARRDGLRSPSQRRHVRALLLCARTALPMAGEWAPRMETHLTALERAVSGDSTIDLGQLDRDMSQAQQTAHAKWIEARGGARGAVRSAHRRFVPTTPIHEVAALRRADHAIQSAHEVYCSAMMPWEMQDPADECDASAIEAAADAWSVCVEQDGVTVAMDDGLQADRLADMADLLRAALPTWSVAFP